MNRLVKLAFMLCCLTLVFLVMTDEICHGETIKTYELTATKYDSFAFYNNNTNQFHFNAWGDTFVGEGAGEYDSFWVFELDLPANAVITGALLRVKANSTLSTSSTCTFFALVTDNRWETSSRLNTTSSADAAAIGGIATQGSGIDWTFPSMTDDTWYESPDLTSLLEARLDDGDYDPAHAENKCFGMRLDYKSGLDAYRVSSKPRLGGQD